MDGRIRDSVINSVTGTDKKDSGVIKAIIFDLGNVLIDFDHRIAAGRISKFTDKAQEEVFNLFFDSGLTGLFEEGKVSPAEFFLQVKKMLNLKLDYAGFLPIWNEIFFLTEKNLAVYNLARRLKSRYKTALLSNINILHFEYIKKAFPVLDAFHDILTSFELGAIKPKEEVYQRALKVMGVYAGETFYTDDRPGLVESASRLGIKSFVFVGLEKLRNDLLNTGIKIG